MNIFFCTIPQKNRQFPSGFLMDIFKYYSRIALIPGSSMPSKYSNIAPPPVET